MKFVVPFVVARTRGDNNVELEIDGRFHLIDPLVHVERLRPYRSRDSVADPVLASEDVAQALASDPRGGTWWEVEDVVAHVGTGSRRRYLVRYKGFSAAFDEWKRTCNVSDVLVRDYEELLEQARPSDVPPVVGQKSVHASVGSGARTTSFLKESLSLGWPMSILGGMLDTAIGLSVRPGRALGLSAGPIVAKDGREAVTEIVTPCRGVLCVAWVCAGCVLGDGRSHRDSNG